MLKCERYNGATDYDIVKLCGWWRLVHDSEGYIEIGSYSNVKVVEIEDATAGREEWILAEVGWTLIEGCSGRKYRAEVG